MKITINNWKVVGHWRWQQNDEMSDTHCSICQLPFESCCQDCLLPGFGCPPIKAPYCSHWFHKHCANRWLDSKPTNDQKVCPHCRTSWVQAPTTSTVSPTSPTSPTSPPNTPPMNALDDIVDDQDDDFSDDFQSP